MRWFGSSNGYHPILSFIVLSAYLRVGLSGTVIVDDSDSSISYSPTWAIGNTCTACTAKPVAGRTYQQTWHDNTRNPGTTDSVWLQYSFIGTGITINGIFCNQADRQDIFITRYDLAFTLDGNSAGGFIHEPAGDNTYSYGQTVFNRQDLSNGQHTIRVDLNQNSMMLFDYLVVTTADSNPSPTAGGGGNGSGSSSTSAPSNTPSSGSTSSDGASSTGSGTQVTVTQNGTAITTGTFAFPSGSASSDGSNTLIPLSGGAISGQNNSSISLSKAAIVGIAFAILALSLIFGFLFFFLWRKRHTKQMQMRIEEPDTFITPTPTGSTAPYSIAATVPLPIDRKSPMNSTHNLSAVSETPRMTVMSNDTVTHSYSGTETRTGSGRAAYSGIATGSEPSHDETGTVISSESRSPTEAQSEAGRSRYRSMASISDVMAPPPYQR